MRVQLNTPNMATANMKPQQFKVSFGDTKKGEQPKGEGGTGVKTDSTGAGGRRP